MNNIISFNEISQHGPSTILERAKNYQNRIVQIRLVNEIMTRPERLAAIIQAIALVLLTGGIALIFSSCRLFCLRALAGKRESRKFIDWESLPEIEVYKAVRLDGKLFQHASEQIRAVKTVTMAAVKQYGPALEYASNSLRQDPDVIKIALAQCPEAHKFIIQSTPEAVDPTKIVTSVVENPAADHSAGDLVQPLKEQPKETQPSVESAPETKILYTDESSLYQILRTNPLALQFASDELKKNRSIVLQAIGTNGFALQFADPKFLNDLELAFVAVHKTHSAIDLLQGEIRQKVELILKFLEKKDDLNQQMPAIEKIVNELNTSEAFFLVLLDSYPEYLKYASDILKDNAGIVFKSLYQNALYIEFASARLRGHAGIITKCVKDNPLAFKFATEEIRRDPKIIELVADHADAMQFAITQNLTKSTPSLPSETNLRNDVHPDLSASTDSFLLNSNHTPSPLKMPIGDSATPKIATVKAADSPAGIKDPQIEQVNHSSSPTNIPSQPATNSANTPSTIISDVKPVSPKVTATVIPTPKANPVNKVLYNDFSTAMEAILKDGNLLEFVSEELKMNIELVKAAVKQNGIAIQFAEEALKTNMEICYLAYLNNVESIRLMHSDCVCKIQSFNRLTAESQKGKLPVNDYEKLKSIVLEMKTLKPVFMKVLNTLPLLLELASEDLKKDFEVVRAAVLVDGNALEFASQELKKEKIIVLKAINQNGEAIRFSLVNMDDEIAAAMLKDIKNLKHIPNLMSQEVFVRQAVSKLGIAALEFASADIRKNKQFMLEMINIDVKALNYVDAEFQLANLELPYTAYLKGYKYADLQSKVKEEIEKAKLAISTDHKAFEKAHALLKDNKDFILSLITEQNFNFLSFVSKMLMNDKKFALELVTKNCNAIKWIGDSINNEKEIWLTALNVNPTLYRKSSGSSECAIPKSSNPKTDTYQQLRNDPEILKAALKDPFNLECCDPIVDKEVLKFVIHIDSDAYTNASEALKADIEIIKLALSLDGTLLKSIPRSFWNDEEVVTIALKNNPQIAFNSSPDSAQITPIAHGVFTKFKGIKDFALAVVIQSPKMLNKVAENFKTDRSFILEAVTGNGLVLEMASDAYKKDLIIATAAIKKTEEAARFVDVSIREAAKKAAMA